MEYQDGGQEVPSAVTIDAQLVGFIDGAPLWVAVRPRHRQRCAAEP
jgi:hypothetical protein